MQWDSSALEKDAWRGAGAAPRPARRREAVERIVAAPVGRSMRQAHHQVGAA